jgi:hypothetical protein
VLTAIEREEMWERTRDRPIPEFYAGSILKVHYRPFLDSDNVRTSVRAGGSFGSWIVLLNRSAHSNLS